jgi:predicted nucleic acid-binding protein
VFSEPGLTIPLVAGDAVLASRLLEVEAFQAVARERLLGHLDDTSTARKRKELAELLAMIDLLSIDDEVIERAKSPFAINVRALDAIHVATAEILSREMNDDSVEFWTHDARQASAALSRGLTVRGL